MVRVGIVGLPNAGKSTLFNALTRSSASVANYPFTTIEPNIGVVAVPDERLLTLGKITNPKKLTQTTIEFVDIAGLVKGASRGEGLGNRFLGHIREVNAILHVIRCFSADDVSHVDGCIDPVSDMEAIEFELILADLETVEKRLEKTLRMQKSGNQEYKKEALLLEKLKAGLEKGELGTQIFPREEDRLFVRDLSLLTMKPVIYVANIGEEDLNKDSGQIKAMRKWVLSRQIDTYVHTITAKLESELNELDPKDADEFLCEMGIQSSALDKIILQSYKVLDLITFYTTKGNETRAWTVKRNTPAQKAAGIIHSDMEHGFIKAEDVDYESLIKVGSLGAAKDKGLIRQEGRDYLIKDGDIIQFRFNVC